MTELACAVITLFSEGRLDHVRRQLDAVRATRALGVRIRHIAVCLDTHADPDECVSVRETSFSGVAVLHVPSGPRGMRLARARNEGAVVALAGGAGLLIFLDADCLPGEHLVKRYEAAARQNPSAILCGPVTYLPEAQRSFDAPSLQSATAPHPARAFPADDESRVAASDEYALFWSLSFAMTAQTWSATGGFCEDYEGYGGEDTDFAFAARRDSVALVWVGGAHAYHQHHPTSSPPWQHLDAILRNGKIFAERWGEWPMSGWLDAFAAAGAIEYSRRTWRRVEAPTGGNIDAPATVIASRC